MCCSKETLRYWLCCHIQSAVEECKPWPTSGKFTLLAHALMESMSQRLAKSGAQIDNPMLWHSLFRPVPHPSYSGRVFRISDHARIWTRERCSVLTKILSFRIGNFEKSRRLSLDFSDLNGILTTRFIRVPTSFLDTCACLSRL